MRVSINNSNLLKGTIVLLLFFGILGGPFSFFGTNTAEALGCVKSNITGALGFQLGTCTLQDVDSGCLAGTAACSTADRTILIALSQCDQYKNCSTAQQADQAAAQKVAVPTQCDVSVTSWSAIFNPICWGRVVGSLIGGLIVYVASWLLTISGVLFNWVLNITVVQFGQFMTSSVIGAITQAWTAFRDVSNIVIIGMFTFIAISIILGLKEFGQKKLIAHVLIIAVLINFSLLFTKMTIDASNFVATQFYNAGLSQSAAGGASSTTQLGVGNCPEGTPKSQCYGIAGAFMDYAGVAGLLDTRQATANLADSLDNGFLAFLHAIFVAVLFTAAALVLFYGTFLLVSRAVLFIFLMAVSSLAFASYLVPVWDKSRFGFGAWKNSLLMNALLAPLLMMFLWMTLNVANAMRTTGTGGTLGDLITNPTKALDINALFSYVVVLGLLFGSFKLSSSLAGKISGFSFVSNGLGTALGLSSALAGFGLQRVVGGGAALFGKRTDAALAAERQRLSQMNPRDNPSLYKFTQDRIDKLSRSKQRSEWLTKQNYNLAQSKVGAFAAKQTGVSSLLGSGDKKANFAEDAKKKAEAAATRAEAGYNLSRGDQNKVRDQEERRRFRETQKTLREQVVATEQVAQASQQQAANQGRQLEQQKTIAEQQARSVETAAKTNKAVLEQEIKTLSKEHDAAPAASQPNIKTQIAAKQQAIDAEDKRIEDAHAEVKTVQMHIDALKENARLDKSKLDAAQREATSLSDPNSEKRKEIRKGAEDALKQAVEGAKKAGADAAERFGTNLAARTLGVKTYGGARARAAYGDKQAKSELRKTLDDLIKEGAPAPTPSTGGGTSGGGSGGAGGH